MNWFDYTLIGILGISLLLNIRDLGKPTEPMSNGSLAALTITTGLLIAGIIVFS